jgi:cbb3-type cytochrome oxidase subunit 3
MSDAGTGARVVRWLLFANVAAAFVELVLVWRRGFDTGLIGDIEVAWAWGELALFLVTAIAFLVWLYRAEVKARALGAEDMMVGPGWAVGWFFIPLVQWVMPFIAVRELWKASAAPRDWQLEPASPLIALWWACWLAASICGNIAFSLGRQEDWDLFVAADVMTTVSTAFFIPAAILLATIVGRIQQMQESPRHLADRFD